MIDPAQASGPPRLPFAFSAGITGHRKEALPSDVCAELEKRLQDTLASLKDEALQVAAREAFFYAEEPPRLIFVSPLADGADQIGARVALALGFELHAILPFARDSYRERLNDDESRAGFDTLLKSATCLLELPGSAEKQLEAYVMTGRATVAHCDILIAVWDGLPPRGRGGTGEVVDLALVNGTPVAHVPIGVREPTRLLWSGFDPEVITHAVEKATERSFEGPHLEQVMTALFAPPRDPQERDFLAAFMSERARRIRARIEYPLLLAAAGVARFKARNIREDACAAEIRDEWTLYRERCAVALDIDAPLDLLETAYSWSDRLATHFAQTYRSGHIFNFLLGGLAVCMGLSAFMFPSAILGLAIAECLITAGIILNTKVGVKNEWHRRWLDYRQLAERLRPMRSLKLLGLAAPDAPGSRANPVPRRWIDWYGMSVWRAMGCPSGTIDEDRAVTIAKAIAEFEIAPQVAYHERHSRQINMLDRRLEKVAAVLFLVTLAVSATVTIGLAFTPGFVNSYNNWFTLVSAGFPALGTAVFGIRFQGDFGGSALRSQATADALRRIQIELAKGIGLTRAADLTEQAARTMLSDLDEWRLVNQQQDLDLL